MTKPKITFYQYVARFIKSNTPSGDVARDIYYLDPSFPRLATRRTVLLAYFDKMKACVNFLNAFDDVFIKYQKYINSLPEESFHPRRVKYFNAFKTREPVKNSKETK